MDFLGKTVLVVGAGVSGVAACRYLIENKSKVFLADIYGSNPYFFRGSC